MDYLDRCTLLSRTRHDRKFIIGSSGTEGRGSESNWLSGLHRTGNVCAEASNLHFLRGERPFAYRQIIGPVAVTVGMRERGRPGARGSRFGGGGKDESIGSSSAFVVNNARVGTSVRCSFTV